MALIGQEVSQDREVEIPEPVRDAYRLYRPSPLYRAHRLERVLDTPAHIYYKYEGVSPAGSHKPNTAVPQAYYNSQAGVRRISTETGAGQWGSAVAQSAAMEYYERIVSTMTSRTSGWLRMYSNADSYWLSGIFSGSPTLRRRVQKRQ